MSIPIRTTIGPGGPQAGKIWIPQGFRTATLRWPPVDPPGRYIVVGHSIQDRKLRRPNGELGKVIYRADNVWRGKVLDLDAMERVAHDLCRDLNRGGWPAEKAMRRMRK